MPTNENQPPPPRNAPEKHESTAPWTDATRQLHEALEWARRGDTPRGIEALRSLVTQHPDFGEAWGHLGYLLFCQSQPAEALCCYRKVLELYPDDVGATRWSGDCYCALGRYQEARRCYRKLEGTPYSELPQVRQLLAARRFSTGLVLRRAAATFCLLVRRLPDRHFWRGLISEMARLGASWPGIRAAGAGRYLTYLSRHYVQGTAYRLPRHPCDLCGCNDFRAVFFFDDQKKVKCTRCGLECVERRPLDGLDAVSATYDRAEVIAGLEQEWRDPLFLGGRSGILRSLFAEIGEPFPKPGGRVFEIGCGEGEILEWLAREGMQASGIETADRLVDACRNRPGLCVWRSTVRELDVPPEHYDLVLAFHVAEHLDKPSLLFEKAARMLRPEGFLVVEVPVPDLCRLPLYVRLQEHFGYGSRAHMHYFQADTVRGYFESHGFQVVSWREYPAAPMVTNGVFLGRKEGREYSTPRAT